MAFGQWSYYSAVNEFWLFRCKRLNTERILTSNCTTVLRDGWCHCVKRKHRQFTEASNIKHNDSSDWPVALTGWIPRLSLLKSGFLLVFLLVKTHEREDLMIAFPGSWTKRHLRFSRLSARTFQEASLRDLLYSLRSWKTPSFRAHLANHWQETWPNTFKLWVSGYVFPSKKHIMWLKQCHKPPIWEW